MHIFKALTDAIDLRIEDLTEFMDGVDIPGDENSDALALLIAGKETIQKALAYYIYSQQIESDQLDCFLSPYEWENQAWRDAYTCTTCGIYDQEDVTGCSKNCGAYCGCCGCDCEGSKTNKTWVAKQERKEKLEELKKNLWGDEWLCEECLIVVKDGKKCPNMYKHEDYLSYNETRY